MLLYYVFFALLAISLATIGTTVVRKFPQAANIDLATLPAEQELLKKRQLLKTRLDEQRKRVQQRVSGRLSPLGKLWKRLQLKFRVYVGKVQHMLHHEERLKLKAEFKNISASERKERLGDVVEQGNKALAEGNLGQAEEYFITAIKLNTHCAPAYRGLADTYMQQGSLAEAKDTYSFLLKLTPNDDKTWVKLAELHEQQENYAAAIHCYEEAAVINDSLSPRFYHLGELLLKINQPRTALEAALSAIELEPKNPKYLDLGIQSAILASDRKKAEQMWQTFRLINPENTKLAEFREQIDAL